MLELQNLTKHYGTKQALDHVSLTSTAVSIWKPTEY